MSRVARNTKDQKKEKKKIKSDIFTLSLSAVSINHFGPARRSLNEANSQLKIEGLKQHGATFGRRLGVMRGVTPVSGRGRGWGKQIVLDPIGRELKNRGGKYLKASGR